MTVSAASMFADYWAKHPNATAREAGDYGIAYMTRLVNGGKFQEGSDFIQAWMGEFSKASSARADMSAATMLRGTASTAPAARVATELPNGISGGKVAAVIAGVGLAIAGAYCFFGDKKQNGPSQSRPTSWTNYIDQQRTSALSTRHVPLG